MKIPSLRPFWRIAGITCAVLVITLGAIWIKVRREIPREILPDVRAGLAARGIADPDKRLNKYLELRYGSMDDPANRERVFLDFFEIDRIKALQFLVHHAPEKQRQGSIDAMSRWVENYQNSLSSAERDRLRERFSTEEGRAMLRRATAQYNSQNVEYRGQTAVVISQLLKTIAAVQN